MPARLTKRDLWLLGKCAVSRWLTTRQVHRWFFADATADAVRKRLRKLTEAGYLRSYRPHSMAEALHAVGPKAKLLLEERGIEVDLEKALPKQIEHFVGTNDIRLAVECGGVRVRYFFAAWELGGVGWRSAIIPDAAFSVDGPRRLTFAVEFDRGTETLDQFWKKIRSYDAGIEGLSVDAVLVVTEATARLERLRRMCAERALPKRPFLGSTRVEICESGAFGPVFLPMGDSDPEAGKHSVLDMWKNP